MKSDKIYSDRVSIGMLLVTIGIVFGDIGTSPLYVLKAIIGERPIDEILVYGGVSCIFWTLVFQTTLKYIIFTLRADNEGEGGIFALYALVKKQGKKLVIPTIMGATALLADGIITPPISVASAVEGLDKIIPDLSTIPIVVVILCVLFFFQRFGTQKVGFTFGPAMVIWFLMLFVLGLNQIIIYPEVLNSLNPKFAVFLLMKYPAGFWILGAVFLCTTGAEALYSDLGHCGRKNIRLTWIFVKICLIINYMGQAAWLIHSNHNYLNGMNPFYEIMPAWFLLSGIIIATFAAIIASQALISGSYTLISEAMSLNFWPRVTVRQPTELKGQIYIPSVNTIIWAGCILMILYFRTSTQMEAAYGLSITIAMMMTTYLLSNYLYYNLKWNKWLVVIFFLIFGTLEFSFFIANLPKIKQIWMFLFIQFFVFTVMFTWYYARKTMNRLTTFVNLGKYSAPLLRLSQDRSIPRFATHLVYLTKANNREEIEEKIIQSVFSKKPKRADVYWFLHLNRTEQPYTLNYEVSELLDNKLFKVTINVGFRVQPRTELYFKKIVHDLVESKELDVKFVPDGSHCYNSEPDFKFIVVQKFLSVENEYTLREGLIMNTYFMIKRLGLRDEKAFGLDKNDVVIEKIPFVYNPVQKLDLTRIS
ncbi:MAG: KUP/HAK/KT family potassium transporter [Bacteroidales bacterium]